MMEYRVWVHDGGRRPRKPNTLAHSVSGAAETFLAGRWEALDAPQSIDLVVEDDHGARYLLDAHAEQTVEFNAGVKKTLKRGR